MLYGIKLVIWELVYTKQAQKDAKKISDAGLRLKVEKLIGDLSGAYLRRINIKHRLVFQVLEKHKVVKIIRMWTHYE